jgi:3-(3-hydroxy-phenyl)propionate hydroxylase
MSIDQGVCIVGAGPVGLTLALSLAREGLPVLVVERDRQPSTEWRASTFHPPTLEMCEALGVLDEMLERGLVAPRYQMRDWVSGRVAEFDLGLLENDTKYPFRLQLEQYKYAEILRKRLSALPCAELRYGTTFTGVSDHPGGITIRLDGDAGPQQTASQWLVGADGASSAVRTFHGLDFPGITYPKRILIISLDAPILCWYPDLTYVNYISDAADHPGMLLKIPDAWRVSFELPDDVTDEQARSDHYVLARLRSVFPGRQPPPPLSTQIFRVHQRIAERFRAGRTLLIGDAAHVNNPSGGMGLNSGIHDAVDLARVLADVVQGVAAEGTLGEWARRRRRAALEDVQQISHRRATEHATTDDKELADILERYAAVAADPKAAHAFLLQSSMIASVRRQREDDGARF